MKFSFVLLTWNRYKFLELCLPALLASIDKPAECEVVVMDNGSTDKTPEVLSRYSGNATVKVIVRKKNYGLNANKKLFDAAKGEYIVVVDDDVLQFPPKIDTTFEEYMKTFPDYGFLALNVVQNEFTNGAKPGPESYLEETRDEKTLQRGPAGGWCACFRRRDYRKIRWRLLFTNLSMKRGEDGFLVANFEKRLSLKAGIIKNSVCFHATGPHYAKQYGHLDREIEKYRQSGLDSFVTHYQQFDKKESK